MNKKVVKIMNINDLYTFVKVATKVDGDVVVTRGRFAVDGKSLMGLMSIDTSMGVTVEYPVDATHFEEFLIAFEI